MKKIPEIFGCGCCTLMMPSCATVPITERKQLSIYPESVINRQASAAFENFRSKTKLINNDKRLSNIVSIGNKIQKSVNNFFLKEKKEDPTTNFEWDYILVDNDKVVNAWCMPGGKIAVYTGLLKITKNNDALAIVMGHEIAHAVAKHTIERQSQAITLNFGTQIADMFLGGAINKAKILLVEILDLIFFS